MRNMFMDSEDGQSKNLFCLEDAVISLLAGDIFHKTKIKRHLLILKIFYYQQYLFNWRTN